MYSLNQELKKIRDLGTKAMQLVDEGEFRKARRILKPIENSSCISESVQATSIVYAEILRRQGKYDEAIAKIKANIGYLWNICDGFLILNCKNPMVDGNTSLYHVEVFGGTACLGVFTSFPENYKTTFSVLANSEDEILERILELGVYAYPKNIEIKVLTIEEVPEELMQCNLGVVESFPFKKYKEDADNDEMDYESFLERCKDGISNNLS